MNCKEWNASFDKEAYRQKILKFIVANNANGIDDLNQSLVDSYLACEDFTDKAREKMEEEASTYNIAEYVEGTPLQYYVNEVMPVRLVSSNVIHLMNLSSYRQDYFSEGSFC